MQILKTDRLVITKLTIKMVERKVHNADQWLDSAVETNEEVTVESWRFDKCSGDIVVTSLYPVCFEEMEALAEHIIHEYNRIPLPEK